MQCARIVVTSIRLSAPAVTPRYGGHPREAGLSSGTAYPPGAPPSGAVVDGCPPQAAGPPQDSRAGSGRASVRIRTRPEPPPPITAPPNNLQLLSAAASLLHAPMPPAQPCPTPALPRSHHTAATLATEERYTKPWRGLSLTQCIATLTITCIGEVLGLISVHLRAGAHRLVLGLTGSCSSAPGAFI